MFKMWLLHVPYIQKKRIHVYMQEAYTLSIQEFFNPFVKITMKVILCLKYFKIKKQ